MKQLFAMALAGAAAMGCGSTAQVKKDGLYADIQTNKGNMLIELYYKATPVTVANFVSLAEGQNPYVSEDMKNKPYYDGTVFHRVIKDFMIQGGDRTATGAGSPGYSFKDEIVDTLRFTQKGQLAMANAGPKTNGSQFFITQVPTKWLNGRHTIFGQVIDGIAIIDSIANVKTGGADKPLQDVTINKIAIIRNGKEAKAFDAVKIFSSDRQAEIKAKEEQEAKLKTFLLELQSDEAKAQAQPSGIKILQLQKGSDEKPKMGAEVKVFYAGYLKSSGQIFDTNIAQIAQKHGIFSQDRANGGGYEPFPMEYSQEAQLIAGFRDALLSMNYGDKVRVFIPAHQGYGERGAGGVIPPNADLVFDLEINK